MHVCVTSRIGFHLSIDLLSIIAGNPQEEGHTIVGITQADGSVVICTQTELQNDTAGTPQSVLQPHDTICGIYIYF